MAGELYAVAGGKGGVGKTTTAACCALLAHEAGHEVVVVDADLDMPNLAALCGVSVAGPTLHDVLADEAALADAIVSGPTGLALVPGDRRLTKYADVDPAGLGAVLSELAADYEYVFVDTGAGITHEGAIPLTVASGVLLVTTPVPVAVDDAARTAALTERLGGTVSGVVVTRAGDHGLSTEEINARIGYDVLTTVPTDPAIEAALAEERPLSSADGPAMTAYRDLVARLVGDDSAPEADASTEAAPTTPSEETAPEPQARSTDEPDPLDEEAAPTASTEPSKTESRGLLSRLAGLFG
ncbi:MULTISPECIES: MinD/ParA family protein [unclassified Haladaptatus]|uniref:MinD/ParA family ATP-binding protein n=1 Tax=unclassified Haladaptatus TaxID=2622732 RepID=UPI0023E85679|nr:MULTISPECIES: MinD/ParA family protein [unclassified Haladaptatus]